MAKEDKNKSKTYDLSRREKIIVVITFVVAVMSLLFNFLLNPFLDEVDRLNENIEQKTLLIQRYSSLANQKDDVANLYDSYEKILGKRIKDEDRMQYFFKEVEDYATKSGVVLEKIKPLSSLDKAGYKYLSIDIEVDGRFNSIFKFIHSIENISTCVKVEAIKIFPQEKSSMPLRAKISLSKLFFKN